MSQFTFGVPVQPSYYAATGTIDYPMTNDYMFRAVLQSSEQTLKYLIASLLHLDPESIQSLIITNPIELGRSYDEKMFILDIAIILNDHTHINLEMQVLNKHNWPERSLSYLCRSFNQINRGSEYVDVSPAIQIGFLNFTPFENKEIQEFYATYQLMNVKDHHVYSDKFRMSVVDLKHIELATPEDREWHIDHWARLFRATTWEDVKMLAKKYTTIDEAAEALYALNANQTIRDQCEAREENIKYEKWVQSQMRELTAANADLTTANVALTAEVSDLKAANSDLEALVKALQVENAALKKQ